MYKVFSAWLKISNNIILSSKLEEVNHWKANDFSF